MDTFQAMTIAGLLVGGMSVALLGSVKVPLARKLGIDEARVGGLVSMFGLAMIPVILLAGFVTDLVGRPAVLMSGLVLLAAGLVVLARSQRYGSALLGVLVLSAAWSALVNVLNVLIPAAFPGSLASATNLANVYFGAGAFLTPLALTLLLQRVRLSSALLGLALVVLMPLVLALASHFPAPAATANPVGAANPVGLGMTSVLAHPIVWLCALAMFFYTPIEAATAAWTTTYLGDMGLAERAASTSLSAFWLTFMTARLATSFCLPPGGETTLVIILAVASVLVLAAMVGSRGRTSAIALVVAAGLAFGPIFPTLTAILLGHTDPSLHGRAVGLFFAVGGIGWTAVPMLMGTYARRTGVQRGFAVAAASAAGLCIVALILAIQLAAI
jgi:fucose permease